MSFSSIAVFDTLPKRLFLEASAGTGKTFSIVHLICQHILSSAKKGELLPMDQIACITFTRAVAKELRTRVKNSLSLIKRSLESKTETGLPYVDQLLTTPELIPSCLRVLRQALFDIDLASLSTIHGFADRLLAKSKEDQGVKDLSQWMSKTKAREWLVDCIEHGHTISLYEWKAVKKEFRSKSAQAMEWLIQEMQRTQNVESTMDLVRRLRDEVRTTWPSLTCDALQDLLCRTAQSYEGTCDRQGEIKSDVARYVSSCAHLAFSTTLEPLWGIYDSAYSWKKLFTKKKKKGVPISDEEQELFRHVSDLLLPLVDTASTAQRVAASLGRCFHSFSVSRELKTPDGVLETLSSYAEQEAFQAFAHKKFQIVIVDEFQDTDPMQWETLHRLFLMNETWHGSFYVVGDPKQSIYSFRHADMYSYLMAKGAFAREACGSLRVNYRATARMVEAINRLFASTEAPQLFFLPKEEKALSVEELQSSLDPGAEVPIIMKLFDVPGKGRSPKEEELFSWLLSVLFQEQKRNIPLDAIAILVKDRYQADRVRSLLQKWKIPALLKRGEKITQTAAYTWLKAAISVTLSPKKKQSYIDLLLSAPTKETVATARLLQSSSDPFFFASFVEAWQACRASYERGGIAALFTHLLRCPLLPDQSVSQWINSLEERDSWYLDLEQLVELLDSRAMKHLSLEELLQRLTTLDEEYADTDGLLLRRDDHENKAVSIITMHSSKGLEFRSVILLGASVRPLTSEEETSEEVAEKIRQFYVSVTRAKERCYLPIPLFHEARERGLSVVEAYFGASSLQETTNWHDSIALHSEKERLLDRVSHHVQASPSLFAFHEESPYERGVYERAGRAIYSPGALIAQPVQWTTFSAVKSRELPILKDREKGDGPLWGLKVHRAIQEVLSNPTKPASFDELASYCPPWLAEEGEAFLQEVWACLTVPLPLGTEVVTPLSLPFHEVLLEHSFSHQRENGELLLGTFDLVIRHEGTLWVVDWKTNQEPSSLSCEALHSFVEEEAYHLQAALYKEAAAHVFPQSSSWGGFFFVFSKHRACSTCHGVVSWT